MTEQEVRDLLNCEVATTAIDNWREELQTSGLSVIRSNYNHGTKKYGVMIPVDGDRTYGSI